MTRIRRSFRRTLSMIALAATVGSTPLVAQAGGWIKAGGSPADYDMGTDPTTAFTGTSSGFIRSNKPTPGTFGTYMQAIDASEYRGKRLRLSAYLKWDGVKDWAGLWMRVDRDAKAVAFDNMQNRSIKGTEGWTQHTIVLDVDPQATAIAFGVLLTGAGGVWIDDLAFDVVGPDVAVTDMFKSVGAAQPRNLDFENPAAKR